MLNLVLNGSDPLELLGEEVAPGRELVGIAEDAEGARGAAEAESIRRVRDDARLLDARPDFRLRQVDGGAPLDGATPTRRRVDLGFRVPRAVPGLLAALPGEKEKVPSRVSRVACNVVYKSHITAWMNAVASGTQMALP